MSGEDIMPKECSYKDAEVFTEQELVYRYRDNFGLSDAIGIEQVELHRKLEGELTSQLWSSTPENRWQVFDYCYTTLYKNLPWLNEGGKQPAKDGAWPHLLRKKSTIFEVGSGKGKLLRHLVTLGHRCTATEITVERGAKHVELDGLEWHTTDGINLANFEQPESYDVVISSQVIEHFHPDDVKRHFENVRTILKIDGEYFFDTPHIGTGPHDLSKVFGFDRPIFMHLREYDFRELGEIARAAGFKDVQAILFYKFGRLALGPLRSRLLYLYYYFVDSVLSTLRLSPRRERSIRRILRLALVPGNIWLVARR